MFWFELCFVPEIKDMLSTTKSICIKFHDYVTELNWWCYNLIDDIIKNIHSNSAWIWYEGFRIAKHPTYKWYFDIIMLWNLELEKRKSFSNTIRIMTTNRKGCFVILSFCRITLLYPRVVSSKYSSSLIFYMFLLLPLTVTVTACIVYTA